MKTYFILTFTLTMFSLYSSFASAERICFKNKSEYELVKSKLPPILQEIPIYLSRKDLIVAAVGNVLFDKGDIRFFFNCTREIKEPIEEKVSICATDSVIEMIFDNNTAEKISIRGPTEINIRGKLNLTTSTKDKFATVSAFIDKKTVVATSKPTSTTTNETSSQ